MIVGPNKLGEYLTVVSNEVANLCNGMDPRRRVVGLAYGVYRIGGECTDPDGFPEEIALAEYRRRIERDWVALKTPGIAGPDRAGKPLRLATAEQPDSTITVTGIE